MMPKSERRERENLQWLHSVPVSFLCPCQRLSNSMPKPQARDGLKLHLIARHVRKHWLLALLPYFSLFTTDKRIPRATHRRTGGGHVYHRHGLWLATHLGSRHALPLSLSLCLSLSLSVPSSPADPAIDLNPWRINCLAAVCVIFMMRPRGREELSSFWLPCRKRSSGYILAAFSQP